MYIYCRPRFETKPSRSGFTFSLSSLRGVGSTPSPRCRFYEPEAGLEALRAGSGAGGRKGNKQKNIFTPLNSIKIDYLTGAEYPVNPARPACPTCPMECIWGHYSIGVKLFLFIPSGLNLQ